MKTHGQITLPAPVGGMNTAAQPMTLGPAQARLIQNGLCGAGGITPAMGLDNYVTSKPSTGFDIQGIGWYYVDASHEYLLCIVKKDDPAEVRAYIWDPGTSPAWGNSGLQVSQTRDTAGSTPPGNWRVSDCYNFVSRMWGDRLYFVTGDQRPYWFGPELAGYNATGAYMCCPVGKFPYEIGTSTTPTACSAYGSGNLTGDDYQYAFTYRVYKPDGTLVYESGLSDTIDAPSLSSQQCLISNMQAGRVVSSTLKGITMTTGGTGYVSIPDVTITGNARSAATARAVVYHGAISNIEITDPGAGYTETPTITVDAPKVTATATATLDGGAVTEITMVNTGEGYTGTPNVAISGDGSSATATATMSGGKITSIAVDTGGSGYSTATVTIDAPGGDAGTTATATAVLDTTYLARGDWTVRPYASTIAIYRRGGNLNYFRLVGEIDPWLESGYYDNTADSDASDLAPEWRTFPPTGVKFLAVFARRLWYATTDTIYASEQDYPEYVTDDTNPDRLSGGLKMTLPGTGASEITGFTEVRGGIVVFTRTDHYIIRGTNASDFRIERISDNGCIINGACASFRDGVVWLSSSGLKYWQSGSDGESIDTPINGDVVAAGRASVDCRLWSTDKHLWVRFQNAAGDTAWVYALSHDTSGWSTVASMPVDISCIIVPPQTVQVRTDGIEFLATPQSGASAGLVVKYPGAEPIGSLTIDWRYIDVQPRNTVKGVSMLQMAVDTSYESDATVTQTVSPREHRNSDYTWTSDATALTNTTDDAQLVRMRAGGGGRDVGIRTVVANPPDDLVVRDMTVDYAVRGL